MALEFVAHLGATLITDFLPDELLSVGEELLDAIVGFLANPAGLANEEEAIAMRGRGDDVGEQLAELLEFILQDRSDFLSLLGRQLQPRLLIGGQVQVRVTGGVHEGRAKAISAYERAHASTRPGVADGDVEG